MVEMDPHHRVLAIINQLFPAIALGIGTPTFKHRQLKVYRLKALMLLVECNDIDPMDIEVAYFKAEGMVD